MNCAVYSRCLIPYGPFLAKPEIKGIENRYMFILFAVDTFSFTSLEDMLLVRRAIFGLAIGCVVANLEFSVF